MGRNPSARRQYIKCLMDYQEQGIESITFDMLARTLKKKQSSVHEMMKTLQHEHSVDGWRVTEKGRHLYGFPPHILGIYGTIAAGPPIPYQDTPTADIVLPMFDPTTHLAFRVRGDSMEHCSILDNDLVVIRKLPAGTIPRSGKTVAVLVPDETIITIERYVEGLKHQRGRDIEDNIELLCDHITLKRFIRREDVQSPYGFDIILEGAYWNLLPRVVQVVGEVVAVLRGDAF